MEKEPRASGRVQSIERVFSIIEMLKIHRELSISELSALLSLDRSTVHRLLATLRYMGYVNQNKENLKYSNSLKFFDIGYSAMRALGLNNMARPFMRQLAEQTNEGVNLAVIDSYCVLYIDKIESQSTIRVNLPLGVYMPSYCTGLGKLLLSALPEGEVRGVFRNSSEQAVRGVTQDHLKLRRYTPSTITDVDRLCEELGRIRAQGYSIDDEEYISGLYCMAAPVYDYRGSVVAAMIVALAKIVGLDIGQRAQEVLPKLLEAARGVSEALGCRSRG